MYGDLARHIQQCAQCQLVKDPPRLRVRPGIFQRPQPSQPFQVVHLDACTICGTEVMIFTCAFSGYMEAVVMRGSLNGRNLSEAFLAYVVCRHGTPAIVISDNVSYQIGGQFPETLQSLGIQHRPVTAYHPAANGKVERKVQSLKALLRSIAFNDVDNWKRKVPLAVFAYNTAASPTTGEKPFFVVHGREPILPGPVNTALSYARIRGDPTNDVQLYTELLEQRVLTTFDAVYKKLKSVQEHYKHPHLVQFDFQVGDQVYLHNDSPTTNTLRPKWSGPYRIVEAISPAVYRISKGEKTILVHVTRLKKHVTPN